MLLRGKLAHTGAYVLGMLTLLAIAAPQGIPAASAQVPSKPDVAQLPSARDVSMGLDTRWTDVQRNAFWQTVRGKDVRWTLQVDEVTTGWFSGFKVRGMASPTLQVSCELEDGPEAKVLVARINKGERVVCAGKLGQSYIVLFGLATVQIDGSIQKP